MLAVVVATSVTNLLLCLLAYFNERRENRNILSYLNGVDKNVAKAGNHSIRYSEYNAICMRFMLMSASWHMLSVQKAFIDQENFEEAKKCGEAIAEMQALIRKDLNEEGFNG
jgi:hypothetical protein